MRGARRSSCSSWIRLHQLRLLYWRAHASFPSPYSFSPPKPLKEPLCLQSYQDIPRELVAQFLCVRMLAGYLIHNDWEALQVLFRLPRAIRFLFEACPLDFELENTLRNDISLNQTGIAETLTSSSMMCERISSTTYLNNNNQQHPTPRWHQLLTRLPLLPRHHPTLSLYYQLPSSL
jgi:hypothetical protein